MAAYGIVEELMKTTENHLITAILGLAAFSCSVYIFIAMMYPAECLKIEGRRTAVITSQIMNKVDCHDSQKLGLIFFMTQLKSRNVVVQNALFKFEWNTFLMVN